MSLALSSPVTGGAQTGFTSPTYTITPDTAPTSSGLQYAVTAKGGTQPSAVDAASSVSRPFTVTLQRPPTLKVLGAVDPVTGVLRAVPKNTWKVIVRKGVTPLAGQAPSLFLISMSMDVPAGSDLADPDNIRAAVSLAVGSLNQASAGIGDSLNSGVI